MNEDGPSSMPAAILTAFGFSDDTKVAPFGKGLINHTWKVSSIKGQFILQRVNDAVFTDPFLIAKNIELIGAWLEGQYPDFLFARPLPASDDKTLFHLEGKGYYRVFPFITGSVTTDIVHTPEQAYEAARKFGEFTRLLSGFPAGKLKETIPGFHDLSLRHHAFREALENGNPQRITQTGPLIAYLESRAGIVTEYERIKADPAFRLRVTHHDTKISNVLFDRGGKGLCVIDLDTVMPGYFISDLGDMFRTYLPAVSEEEKDFSLIEIRPSFFEAIVTGYLDEMRDEMTTNEKQNILYAGEYMIYMQSLRFLTDYLNDDRYYGSGYEGHNFVRADNQATLLKRFQEQASALQKIVTRAAATVLFLCTLLLLTGNAGAQSVPSSEPIKYTIPTTGWDADSLGNIRAIITFTGSGPVAVVEIPWRRSDPRPIDKRIIVQDGRSGQLVPNVLVIDAGNASGRIAFEPKSGKGDYYIYYMPAKNEGRSNYPKGVYLTPISSSDTAWLKKAHARSRVNASAREIQSIDAFNSPFPMEVIATEAETAALVKRSGHADYIIFPEDRRYPIRMTERLPYRWIQRKQIPSSRVQFTDTAAKGENYTWQLGIYAIRRLSDMHIQFSALSDGHGNRIPAEKLYCFNTGGVDYAGKAFTKIINVDSARVQALWCGADIPASIPAGTYSGSVTVSVPGASNQAVSIRLQVRDSVENDHGISEPWKQTRLKWLNSTLMQDNTVVAPYTALTSTGRTIHLLGRDLDIGDDGLPCAIRTFFTPEMTGYTITPKALLEKPLRFEMLDAAGHPMSLKAGDFAFTRRETGTIGWQASAEVSDALNMVIHGRVEFDGFLQYDIRLTALQDVDLSDISLYIPFKKENARFLMGLGQKGEDCPPSFDWKWQVATRNQDGAWIGSVNAGLQFSLRDERYVRPLNTNFYLQKPLLLPTSWGNDNKGGVHLTSSDSSVLVRAFSGSRSMKKGDSLFYNLTLLITPFHPVNTDFQWATRFYHRYNEIDSIRATGATVINIHHATPINPWINYPFIEYKKMKAYIDEAHAKGMKVKIYNTVRELSDHAYELFPMRSLGHEIYSPGKGGGFSWLQEHVRQDYIPAWFVPEIKDAALVNSGMSRWHNYYVEGMNWLVQNVGIDGIYLDDVAFDRITMKRIKRVLTQDGHPGIIDLHSANQYNKSDGFNNSANLYMEHFPYLNRLWFGEYFDYQNNDPSFFLTEVSGIPFGLMGEMLQDGGNQWRGMLYGMTNRLPWSEGADPRPLWQLWDSFGMQGTEMIGYWSGHCPVTTSDPRVLATIYRKKGAALIAIASWAPADVDVRLSIDWKKLGIDSGNAVIAQPAIKNFQIAGVPGPLLHIEKGKGYILIVKEKLP